MTTSVQPQTTELIQQIQNDILKSFGKNSCLVLGRTDVDQVVKVPVIPTPSIGLNKKLGCGGIPVGRITEAYGTESGGKTTMMLQTGANCQKAGGIFVFNDIEQALDVNYARALGVDIDNLIILKPDFGEEAIEMTNSILPKLNQHDKPCMFVVDSVSALVPKQEIEGDMTDANMGAQARLMNRYCRVITPNISNVAFVFINQIRMKLGVMFGSPETTSGGNALKFFSSVRLDIRVKERKEDHNMVNIKVIKNKLAPPYREHLTKLVFGSGISELYDLIEEAVDKSVIDAKSGGHYSYKGEKLVQGKDNLFLLLQSKPELFAMIKSDVEGLLS